MAFADVSSTLDNTQRFTNATLRPPPSEPASPTLDFMSSLPRTPDYAAVPSAKRSRCACGARVDQARGIYCSIDCARNDAFSSLTHTRATSSTSSLGGAFDDRSFGRAPSVASCDDDGSHYRRIKREERRELERMRRADITGESSSSSPESTRSPSAVPDLVSSHSRNTSAASSILSLGSCSSLSRNPSTSSRVAGYPASVVIDDAIMEDDTEVLDDIASARSTLKARRRPGDRELAPVPSVPNNLMVNDMLDEIINMEESFRVPEEQPRGRSRTPLTPERAEFVPTAFRPPRTPSPVLGRRSVIPPGAPSAAARRRSSLVLDRPPSLYAHQPSLSESHTALYLATASPVPKSNKHRRSASPMLSVRRSLTFNRDAAGPVIPPRNFDSPGLTPVRRKHLTPNAHHPPMQGWRFPTAGSNNVTPTRGAFAPLPDVNDQTQLFPRPARTSSLSKESGPIPAFSPPSSSIRLGMLMNSDSDAMDFDDDASTVRGSIRQSFAAPVAPFTRPGW